MANPTRADVHIDTLATQFSIAYKNPNGLYIADQILPAIRVAKATGKYAVFDRASWFRDEASNRAPGARANLVEWAMDTAGSYSCEEYAAAYLLPDETRENADNPIVPERTAAEFVTDKILLAREKRVADLLFNTTTFSGYTAALASLTGGAGVQWNTYETSDPLQDVEQMSYNVMQQVGYKPNTMVLGAEVYKALKQHPVLMDRIKYTQMGVMTTELMASLFEMEKVLVGRAIYTASEEGTTFSASNIWDEYVLVAYVPRTPALEIPALGYILNHKDRTVNRYRQEENHADLFECLENSDEIVTCAPAGYLCSNCIA